MLSTLISAESCSDTCGLVAALFGSFCYGSYGVPVKATAGIDVHPLILQTYKTSVVFVCSWAFLFLILDVEARNSNWTPLGLVSGFLWVTGGCFGNYAIRTAGIALAVGTWASVMVLVNFVWGILVFHEPVQSVPRTCGAFFFLGLGLIGMTRFSSSKTTNIKKESKPVESTLVDQELIVIRDGLTSRRRGEEDNEEIMPIRTVASQDESDDEQSDIDDHDEDNDDADNTERKDLLGQKNATGEKKNVKLVHFCGQSLSPQQAGVTCAFLNGLLSGSSLVPLHYAKEQGFSDTSYFVSFSSGALIVNMIYVVLYFLSLSTDPSRGGSIVKPYQPIPRWHFKQLWFKMFMAGILLSGGMLGSIVATSSLGQAVGNSLIQSKILISGLWGICCYQEIKDRRAIINWFLSASLSVISILWLTYERHVVSSINEASAVLKPKP
jgi:glucose uptake protein GlcU